MEPDDRGEEVGVGTGQRSVISRRRSLATPRLPAQAAPASPSDLEERRVRRAGRPLATGS